MRNQSTLRILQLVLACSALVLAAMLVFTVWYMKASADRQPDNASVSETFRGIRVTNLGSSKAPNFTLIDQRGRQVSLDDFRGKAVVLSFMDPHCTDVCPVVSQEYVQAAKKLGDKNDKVVFLAVNVNTASRKVSDVRAFSNAHGLENLSTWHFLTGSPSDLKRVWKDYGIGVIPSKTGDVQHSDYLYFLDPNGREQWLSGTSKDKGRISAFASLIAHYSEKSLGG